MVTGLTSPPNVHPAEAPDHGPSWLELLPLPTSSTSILGSSLFVPGVLTAIVACLLFFLDHDPPNYFRAVSYYIVLMILVLFYINAAHWGRWMSMVVAGLIVAAILWTAPVLDAFMHVFRTLPGIPEPTTNDISENFVYYFVGAGLMEELIKAVPALIGLVIVLVASLVSGGRPSGWFVERFGVYTPMHGLLMGLAAGAAFTLIETLEQYVPNAQAASALQVATAIQESLEQTGTDPQLRDSISVVIEYAAQKSGLASGFFLLLPRVLGALIGHMSYAGIFGYFIGLAGHYRGVWTLPLVAFGWVVASFVHGAWNSAPSPYLIGAVGLASFVLFFSYYLKAFPGVLDGVRRESDV